MIECLQSRDWQGSLGTSRGSVLPHTFPRRFPIPQPSILSHFIHHTRFICINHRLVSLSLSDTGDQLPGLCFDPASSQEPVKIGLGLMSCSQPSSHHHHSRHSVWPVLSRWSMNPSHKPLNRGEVNNDAKYYIPITD